MSMTTSFLEQRRVLRIRLQNQRVILDEQMSIAEESQNSFPRSMTMRLLTNRSSLSLLIVTEIFPQLLRYVLTKSGFRS